ncbi:MAG: hypothetical protein WAX69_08970 [Victivallales bacterium]
MDDRFPKATLLKKDYIAYLAVGLFIFVIVFEILLVVWLPRKLHSSIMWEDQIASEEMVELEDLLRAYMVDIRKHQKDIDGEIALVKGSLDEIAGYLREHKDRMSRSQIDDINRQLKYFESIYRSNMKPGKSFITTEKIDSSRCLAKMLDSSGAGRDKANPEKNAGTGK